MEINRSPLQTGKVQGLVRHGMPLGQGKTQLVHIGDQIVKGLSGGHHVLHGEVKVIFVLIHSDGLSPAGGKADIHQDVRISLCKGGETFAQGLAGGGHGGDGHMSLGAVLRLLHPADGVLRGLHNLHGIREELPSRVRHGDAAPVPKEQPGPQLLLQLADMMADGGLGDAVALGRLGEVQGLRHRDEIVQLIHVHGVIFSSSLPQSARKKSEAAPLRIALFFRFFIILSLFSISRQYSFPWGNLHIFVFFYNRPVLFYNRFDG